MYVYFKTTGIGLTLAYNGDLCGKYPWKEKYNILQSENVPQSQLLQVANSIPVPKIRIWSIKRLSL